MSKRRARGGPRHPAAEEVRRDQLTPDTRCGFCGLGETGDILQSGRLYRLAAGRGGAEYYHYFCCLFSSQGVQRGKDEEGLNGFLLEDIRKEVKRGESLMCDFCKKTGATIPCKKKSCRKVYHFSCGALCTAPGEHYFIFLNNMDSWCWAHAPRQTRPSNLVADPLCMVCLEQDPPPGPGPGRLVSPCCGRTFHRDCVQKTALQAGKAALKCPACNDKETFNEEMELRGIYVPHADAQWEMPENSNFYRFDDMLQQYRKCDAVLCLDPRGREDSRPGTQYEVITCQTCGQAGSHIACGRLDLTKPAFVCESCRPDVAAAESSGSDSDDQTEEARRHEEKRLRLVEEKNRLVAAERERLAGTRARQQSSLQQIRNILAGSEEEEVGAGPSTPPRRPPAVLKPRPRLPLHLPRRLPRHGHEDRQQDSSDSPIIIPDSEDEEDETELKIDNIFSIDTKDTKDESNLSADEGFLEIIENPIAQSPTE